MTKKLISMMMFVCMMLMVFAPGYAEGSVQIKVSAKNGSGTYYVYTNGDDREKVEVTDAIIADVEITGCEDADVCSGIIDIKYDAQAVKCIGYNSETAGEWAVNDKNEGLVQIAFSSAESIDDGIVFSAAFEVIDPENTERAEFKVEVEELLTGDVVNGDVPGEYMIATESAVYDVNAPEFIMGDANDDGTVNTADATCVLRYAADMIQLSEKQLTQGDVNYDGTVNTADATLILKFAAGMITEF